MSVERMVWSGQCESCDTLVYLVADDEAPQSEQEAISSEWPESGDCYVQDCGGTIDWNGNDPVPVVIR